jgi:succinate-semialdehyde dehydrogenase/glutarate-semialdehyde dehydrogenase
MIKGVKIGDALDEKTDMGPLVAKRQLDLLTEQVNDALHKGAKVITGGKPPSDLQGAYFEPTLLNNISKEMRVWQEEVFGPVLPIMTFKTEQEAIHLANDTTYGLGAFIYTNDKNRFMRVAKQIESGMVSQNALSYVNVHNPFGGYKMSGKGREHAQFGFRDVTQVKVIAKEK